MKPVTDPGLLSQLEGGAQKRVTDPALLAQLEGAAPSGDQADPTLDVIKSTGAGIGKGAINVLGAPGDIGALANRGAEAIGVPEGVRSAVGGAVSDALFPGLNIARRLTGSKAASLPTSQQLQGFVEQNITGEFYKPQTTAGKYAGTIGEFAPGTLIPASKLGRVANVVVPGVASEAAGQATEGTAAEPYARAGAALLGGAGASRIGRVNPSTTQRAVGTANERIAEVDKAASRLYESPAVKNVEFRPGVVDALVNQTYRQLGGAARVERVSPETHRLLEAMRTPISGARHTIDDLQITKTDLAGPAGNFANKAEKRAATTAIENIKTYLGGMPQGHLARGNAAEAAEAWTAANANTAAARTAQKVQDKLYAADVQAATANTGANSGNANRQKLRTLLTNPKQRRGLTEAEGEAIEQTVKGSRLANVLRSMGDATGGGGGARSLVALLGGGGAGAVAGLGPFGFALPFVGSALRGAGNAITKNQANKIVDAILERAPETAAIQQRGQQAISDRKLRALIAQLSLGTLPAVKAPTQQPGY